MRGNRGEAVTGVLVLIILIGGWLFAAKPKFLNGESKRAKQSTETTAKLNEAHEKKEAVVAADVYQIAQVAATLPESREKDFIEAESALIQGRLKAPDPQELLESEKRKNAVLAGELKVTKKLYEQAAEVSVGLLKEVEKVKADKTASDLKLETTAAAHLAAERQRNQAILAVGIVGILWLYTRATRLSPGALAEAVTDMRSGKDGLSAIDSVTTRSEQMFVRLLSKFRKP